MYDLVYYNSEVDHECNIPEMMNPNSYHHNGWNRVILGNYPANY